MAKAPFFSPLSLVNLLLLVFVVVILLADFGPKAGGVNVDEENRVAAALANRGLYKEAEARLRPVIDDPGVSGERRAKALFQVGTWHLQQAKDPEAALAAFVELRERFPDSSLAKEAAKKEVACLDVLGRPLDAKGVMDETVRVDDQKVAVPREGVILAQIGDREITSGDLDAEVRRLPPELQENATDKTMRRELLQSLIARELLYDSAKAQGLENDKDVLRSTAEAKKGVMVMELIDRQTKDKVNVDPVDVKNYFEANKEKLKGRDGSIPPFEKVKDALAQRLLAKKKMALIQKMIEDLTTSRNVKIHEERL